MLDRRHVLRGAAALLLTLVPALVASAQASFEAASIRPNASGQEGADWVFLPGGTFNAQNTDLAELIATAYSIEPFRIVDAPDWIRSARYDIQARTGVDVTQDETRVMLQQLLQERFGLRPRLAFREMPVLALVVNRTDGRIGPRLRSASPDACVDRGPLPINVPAGAPPSCGRLFGNPGRLSGRRVPIELLATRLSLFANRRVMDRTGLRGMFDIDLDWAPDLGSSAVQQDTLGLVTALVEQLGLKLEPATATLGVLVVESIHRPTEN